MISNVIDKVRYLLTILLCMHLNSHNSNLQKAELHWDLAWEHLKNLLGLLNLSFANIKENGLD